MNFKTRSKKKYKKNASKSNSESVAKMEIYIHLPSVFSTAKLFGMAAIEFTSGIFSPFIHRKTSPVSWLKKKSISTSKNLPTKDP